MDRDQLLLEEWKLTKDRISHFDEIVIKLRLEGISLALLIIGVGFTIVQVAPKIFVIFFGISISAAGIVFVLASMYLIAVFFFDLLHFELLKRSVGYSIDLEKQLFPNKKAITQQLTSENLTRIHSWAFYALYLIIISLGISLGLFFKSIP